MGVSQQMVSNLPAAGGGVRLLRTTQWWETRNRTKRSNQMRQSTRRKGLKGAEAGP